MRTGSKAGRLAGVALAAALGLALVLGDAGRPGMAQGRLQQDHEPVGGGDSVGVDAFVDSYLRSQMRVHNVPGAVFVLVQGGEIQVLHSVGDADRESFRRVEPETTRFPLGTLEELVTALLALQLAGEGQLDLHGDANGYLRAVQIASEPDAPVTLFHLLTHTSGLSPAARDTPARALTPIVAPGTFVLYAPANAALAAEVVAGVAGEPLAGVAEGRLFAPLGMTSTAFLTGDSTPADLATGYAGSGSELAVAAGAEGGLVSSGADMGRLLLALLDEESPLAGPAGQMAARQAAQHPGLPGMGFGLRESGLLAGREDGLAAFFLDGEADGFRSRIFLAPQAGWGFFVAHNNGSASEMNGALTRILLETYFPGGTPENRGDEAATRPLAEFAGRYRPVTGGGLGRLLPGPERVEVAVAGDGLAIDGQPVRRLGDDLFADESGDRVAFRVEDGQASYLLRDTFAYEREQREGLAFVLFGAIVLLIASLGGLAARRWRKR